MLAEVRVLQACCNSVSSVYGFQAKGRDGSHSHFRKVWHSSVELYMSEQFLSINKIEGECKGPKIADRSFNYLWPWERAEWEMNENDIS